MAIMDLFFPPKPVAKPGSAAPKGKILAAAPAGAASAQRK